MRRGAPLGAAGCRCLVACGPVLVTAALLVPGAAVASTATGSTDAASCDTSLRVGFDTYAGNEPPGATHELRGVVTTKCGRPPQGRCVATSYAGGRSTGTSQAPVLPSSGRCRFILSLGASFPRSMQYLGPETRNGTLDVTVQLGLSAASPSNLKARLVLARRCR